MLLFFGLMGGLLSIISNIPYVIDTLKGKTQPHRVTWGLFFLLNIIFLLNHTAAGATNSIWQIVGVTFTTFIIFSLSIKHGVGGSDKLDFVVIAMALTGVMLWVVLDSPLASILANTFASVVAGVPSLKKAYLRPGSETKIKWFIGIFAGISTIISVGRLEFALLILPIVFTVFQATMFMILVLSKHKVA